MDQVDFEITAPVGDFFSDLDGRTILNLKSGIRITNAVGSSIGVSYGTALTNDVWYNDIVRFEFRLSF